MQPLHFSAEMNRFSSLNILLISMVDFKQLTTIKTRKKTLGLNPAVMCISKSERLWREDWF